jgi:putative hydrolases of HD superfamily
VISSELQQQIHFLREIDKLKGVLRQSPLLDQSRKENSAEHSWHLAMYAFILSEHAAAHVNVARVIKMLLIHDIAEIDAGDTPLHGQQDGKQFEREQQAAKRLFGLLPNAQGDALNALWHEFEEGQSDDAQFARALDRFQPLLINVFAGGGTWVDGKVEHQQVLERYGPAIQRGAPALWALAREWVAGHFDQSSTR